MGERVTVRIPGSTYRLQLHRDFGFAEVVANLDYLDALGITDIYVSPVFAARPGSQHGYDVVDPGVVNSELGGEEGLRLLSRHLAQRGMGLLLDFVPNHMCVAGGTNRFWIDVLENGPSSPFARYFDIDWTPPKPDLAGQVLLPILGDQYGRVLERGELRVELRDGALALHYLDSVLPLAPRSWLPILETALARLDETCADDLPCKTLLESILTALRHLPLRTETDEERLRERHREKEVIKTRLAALVEESEEARAAIRKSIAEFNGNTDDPRSFDRLDAVLSDQAYRLSFWRVAADEINYRRFFDINELAAIRIEDPEVFAAVHAAVFELIRAGETTGLRIDHVDGLFDPAGYLKAIHQAVDGESRAGEKDGPGSGNRRLDDGRRIYLVVEKILAEGERMPDDWPIHGTTGYDFLNLVGGVFVDRSGARHVHEMYRRFTGQTESFEDLTYRCKKLVLRHSMSSQVTMLARQLDRISEQHRHSRDFTFQSLHDALVETLARFPVYRTYVMPGGVASNEDRRWIDEAIAAAIRHNQATSASHFEFLRQVLVGEDPQGLDSEQIAERRNFVLRLQQLTGAVMAKAVEDTAFYRFFPLASRGEVGGTPDQPGVTVEDFHARNAERLNDYPHSLLATTTHDTKRSEDVRSRIRVLSEMPDVWRSALERFHVCNARHKALVDGRAAPDANEEYLLYQTLLGAWPSQEMDRAARSVFVERVQGYMQKALREAKVHSSWLNPNQAWEDAVATFVRRIVEPSVDNEFLSLFLELERKAARVGVYGSLAQVVLKAAAPGVPDVYQGNELLDLSLVDPDNRRPIDFRLRRRWLAEIERESADGGADLAARLLRNPEDGRVKLFVTARALRFRRLHRELFDLGGYHPIPADGPRADHVIAFSRTQGHRAAVVVVGRLFLALGADDGTSPVGERVWGDTRIHLDGAAGPGHYRDAFTGTELHASGQGVLDLAQVFSALPVALLERTP